MQHPILGIFIFNPWYVNTLRIWSLGGGFANSDKLIVCWVYACRGQTLNFRVWTLFKQHYEPWISHFSASKAF